MKKILLLGTIVWALFFCGTAMATPYSLLFDADASGTDKVQEQIYGWDLEAIDLLPGIPGDFVTEFSLGGDDTIGNGDTWTEFISMNIPNGLGSGYGAMVGGAETGTTGYYNFPTTDLPTGANIYLEISLDGYITDYDSGADAATTVASGNIKDDYWRSVIENGTGRMFVDGDGNQIHNGSETVVSTFSLANATDFFVQPSVWTGTGSLLSLAMTFDSINSEYFATAPGEQDLNDLIGKEWLLSMSQGSIGLEGYEGDDTTDPDTFNLTWTDTGWDARFEAVPEPTTMILFGAGLLGIAGISRKKFKADKV